MKILIVEDEFASRSKLDKLIQGLGHETLVAENGLDGWEKWEKERPRIVITDWVMPELDGIDLCKKIREAEGDRYTYVIMVTSKTDVQDIIIAMNAGADDFISKPYIKEELLVRIRAGQRVLSFETRDMVIFSMANLAESRDPETGNHLERIRFYSRTLAESLLKSNDPPPVLNNLFVENIFLTSPLHDIGKIGIPDYILLKPGLLDDDEFETMKGHCQIGYDTLNDALTKYPKADYLRMSAEIAISHHERWDGTGYPNGIKGKDIPLSARIVALADVYDALVNKRVYKDACEHKVARAVILEDSGSHFDPMVIDAFLASEKKFVEICDKFNE